MDRHGVALCPDTLPPPADLPDNDLCTGEGFAATFTESIASSALDLAAGVHLNELQKLCGLSNFSEFPHGFLELFRRNTCSRSRPTMRSKSVKVAAKPSPVHRIVSGSQQVARVQAHANPWRSVYVTKDRRQVLETMAEVCALSRGVFEDHFHALPPPAFQQFGNRTADGVESILLRPGRVRAWMHDEAIEAKQFRAVQFFAKSLDRLRPQRRCGSGDIDQVTVMRNDRRNPGLLHPSPEQRHLVTGQFASTPLTSGLREDSAARRTGWLSRGRPHAAARGNRHVGPEEWHIRRLKAEG